LSTLIMAACWPIDIPSTQKFVLISLADNANDNGICWPSIPTICRRTSLHRATVLRAISWLTEHGYIAVNRETGRHNSYRIAAGSFPQPVAQRDGSQNATGRTERPDPSHKATGPVAQRDPNRNEPSRTVISARVRARERDGQSGPKKGGMTDALEFFAKAAAAAKH
jgi:hypothetical protein